MLSLNQEIAKRIHNAQIDNYEDDSPSSYVKAFGLGALDGLVDCCLITGALILVTKTAKDVVTIFKRKKG